GIIEPAKMSSDVIELQQGLIQITRELAGAGDAATGQVDPEDASGRAILAVQQANRSPMTEQKEGCKGFIEDLARIYLDYLIVYSVDGVNLEEKVNDPQTGEETYQVVNVPQSALEQLKATVKVDITPKGAYDRFAQEQTIENLLINGLFSPQRVGELRVYAEALDDESVAPKQKILEIVEKTEERMRKIAMMNANAEIMQQRAQQFLMSDVDAQADQMANAQMQMQAQQAAQVEGEKEYAKKEAALDKEIDNKK
ncbi:MAG: hypothetical protein IKY44_02000, partial [Clostridia bacterium]|nr:hypothetical protein [Clostridia bacterium]